MALPSMGARPPSSQGTLLILGGKSLGAIILLNIDAFRGVARAN